MVTIITTTITTAEASTPEMTVPLLDLPAQYRRLREELRAAVDRVMESQQFVLGPEVQRLEAEFADYTHVKHAIGCASGSDALLLALMALGIGAGDEVITTPYTFFATVSAITRLGARPVFVDIDPLTYNIDSGRVVAAITERTRAIIPVHLFGQCASLQEFGETAAERRIPIVEDAAQAVGAEGEDGYQAGAMGAIGCFSFFPSKNLGAAGDGGMLVTSDDELAGRLRMLRTHGGATEYQHRLVGINSRLDALQAAVLRVKLPYLDQWSNERTRNAERYHQLFAEADLLNVLTLPVIPREARHHIFNQYVIRVLPQQRDELMQYLQRSGIGVKVYYPVPLHLQECFRPLGYRAGDFPIAEAAARETLALPIYPELSVEQQHYVVDTVRRFYHSNA